MYRERAAPHILSEFSRFSTEAEEHKLSGNKNNFRSYFLVPQTFRV